MREKMMIRNMFLIRDTDDPDEDLPDNLTVRIFVNALSRQVIV